VTANGQAIVAALRTKSPQRPGELAKMLKLARPALTYNIKPLLKSGAVIATGATMNRQFSLPPRSRAAKEAP
jgi:DNA-binding Lrp family transcriptional regulator